MPKVAGFYCEIDNQDASGTPLLLLHGSGQDESAWNDIAENIAPDAPRIRLRGNIVWENRYAFFRRNPDRSLDQADLVRAVDELALFIETLVTTSGFRMPILVGYSNGAIVVAAFLAGDTGNLTTGAILMRALSPDPQSHFRDLSGYPVLILSGADDSRRAPEDGALLARQLKVAGADVTHQVLPCGHGWDESGGDVALSRQWLQHVTAA